MPKIDTILYRADGGRIWCGFFIRRLGYPAGWEVPSLWPNREFRRCGDAMMAIAKRDDPRGLAVCLEFTKSVEA